MANDITGIIDSLSNNVGKLEKIKDAKEVADVIDSLLSLANESASYGGEIARVVPLNIKNVLEPLNSMFEDYKTTVNNALTEFNKLVEYIDNIPLGQLRQKSVSKNVDSQAVQDSINNIPVAPQVQNSPQSAIVNNNPQVQNESLTLESLYKRDFSVNSDVYEKFNDSMLDKITESVDLSILDEGYSYDDDYTLSSNQTLMSQLNESNNTQENDVSILDEGIGYSYDDDTLYSSQTLMSQLNESINNNTQENDISIDSAFEDIPTVDFGVDLSI